NNLILHYRGKNKVDDGTGENLKEAQEREKLKKAKADARYATLRADMLERSLVDFEKLQSHFTELATTVRNRLLNLDKKLAPLVIQCSTVADGRKVCREEIENALSLLVDELDPQRFAGERVETEEGGDRDGTD